MIFGSVCSGIEAASVAWHPLGWRAAWLAEIEAFPSAVLAARFPEVPNLGDMMAIAEMVRRGWITAPDVFVGGTPCQAFSVAGLRGGLSDERGALTLEYIRILDEIDRKRVEQGQPECVAVWENVPGVLSSRDNAFGCFLAGLAGESPPLECPGGKWPRAGLVIGSARSVAWRVLDAQFFGVAQRRRRVFVVASARAGFDPGQVLFEFDGVRRDIAPSRKEGQGAPADVRSGASIGSPWDHMTNPHPSLSQSHNTGGIGQSNQELFSQRGAGIVPETVGALDTECGFQRSAPQSINSGHLIPEGFRQVAFGEYSGDGTASTMKARDYRGATDLVAHSIHGSQDPIVGVDRAHCLGRNNGRENAIALGMRVRRLTPVECERLQGFPDGYTLIDVKGKPCGDGGRYKALGNSMAVPCMAWIGARIAAHLEGELK